MKRYYLLLAVVFFPVFGVEVVDKTGLTHTHLLSANKILRILWFFVVVLVFFSVTKLRSKVTVTQGFKWWLCLFLILTISVLVNTPQSIVAWYRVFETMVALAAIVLVTYKALEYGEKPEIILLRTMFLVATMALFVVLVYLVIDKEMVWVKETQGRTRLGGYVYSPNMLGAFMSFGIASALALLKRVRSNPLKIVFYIVSSAAFFFILVATGSRTSLALLVIFISIYFFIYINRKYEPLERIVVFLILVILGLCFFIFLYMNIIALVEFVGKGQDPFKEILTLNNRTVVFSTALDGLIENPFSGVGYVVGVENYYADNFPQRFWLPPHTHNGVFEILMALGGISGSIVLGYISFYLFIHCKQIFYRQDDGVYISVCYVVLFGLSMTTVPFGNVYGPLCGLFWMTMLLTKRLGYK